MALKMAVASENRLWSLNALSVPDGIDDAQVRARLLEENIEIGGGLGPLKGRIWRIGLEDIGTLSVEERTRFFHAAYQFLKAFETIHFHYVYGLMDRQLWKGWEGLLRHYVVAPGMAHYWKLRPEVFSERFRNFVNSLEPPPDQRTVGTLFGEERK